jgi:hypothetical protein
MNIGRGHYVVVAFSLFTFNVGHVTLRPMFADRCLPIGGHMNTDTKTVFTMPFGKHLGKPLADVPEGYLKWLAGTLRPSALLRAFAAELARRGIVADVPPEPSTPPTCLLCKGRVAVSWQRMRDGRHYIRGNCSGCKIWRFLPQTAINVELADNGTQ